MAEEALAVESVFETISHIEICIDTVDKGIVVIGGSYFRQGYVGVDAALNGGLGGHEEDHV